MKTNLFHSSLALMALCAVVNLHAANHATASLPTGGELPLREVAATVAANGDTVTVGTSRIMVSLRLGSPNTVLADGSWLYSGYTARLGESGPSRDGTLVIRFANSQITSLSLADKATITALRQAPRIAPDDKLLAAR
ncbi:MAG: hypothetical protein HYX71_04875 [Opitutae bacterium]|nr:hypothetical protein [Opitutae bacterium]